MILSLTLVHIMEFFNQHGKTRCKVHCFEPNPMSYVILKKNIENNDFKKKPIINCAVSSVNSKGSF